MNYDRYREVNVGLISLQHNCRSCTTNMGWKSIEIILITLTSYWVRWPLKSTASRLFTQPFIQATIKEIIKAPRHWPLCGEFTHDRWIPRTRASNVENLMTSSCYCNIAFCASILSPLVCWSTEVSTPAVRPASIQRRNHGILLKKSLTC